MESSIFLLSAPTPRSNPSNCRCSILIGVLVWINRFERSEQIVLLLWIHWQTCGNLSICGFVDTAGSCTIGFTSGNTVFLDFGFVVAAILTRIFALISTSIAVAFQTHFVETALQRLFLINHFIAWNFLQNLWNRKTRLTLNTNEPCNCRHTKSSLSLKSSRGYQRRLIVISCSTNSFSSSSSLQLWLPHIFAAYIAFTGFCGRRYVADASSSSDLFFV